MARRSDGNPNNSPLPPAKLTVSREQASTLIQQQITEGEEFETRLTHSSVASEQDKEEIGQWKNFTVEVLRRIFDTEEYSDKFKAAAALLLHPGGFTTFVLAGPSRPRPQRPEPDQQKIVKAYLNNLRLLHKSLSLIPETDGRYDRKA